VQTRADEGPGDSPLLAAATSPTGGPAIQQDDNTTGRNDVSASEQLYKLADRAKQSEDNIERAKDKGQAELRSQVEQARQSSQERAAELKRDAGAAKTKASTSWGEVQDDWNQHIAKVRANVDDRKAEHDVKRAERRAEDAEDDAAAAVDFAFAAIEEAEYAVLDATLARLDADEAVAAR
jgi:vacuolar-type H+-ATPase subunit I/STV1